MSRINRYVLGCFILVAILSFGFGFNRGRHANMVWVDNHPSLYTPIFYNHDSLMYYAERAYLYDDAEALAITGTASYNLHIFDKDAHDSLPAVSLEEADIMLLHSAELGYEPAAMVIHYLDQLDLWHHSIPEYNPDMNVYKPAKGDRDYKNL